MKVFSRFLNDPFKTSYPVAKTLVRVSKAKESETFSMVASTRQRDFKSDFVSDPFNTPHCHKLHTEYGGLAFLCYDVSRISPSSSIRCDR
jgi:hypothetical protein